VFLVESGKGLGDRAEAHFSQTQVRESHRPAWWQRLAPYRHPHILFRGSCCCRIFQKIALNLSCKPMGVVPFFIGLGNSKTRSKFKFRRFQGGSRAARQVKFPPANRSWRGAGGRDLRPKCHLPCSAEKLGELGDPGFQARLFWKRLWHFFLVADPPQGRQHVGKRWLFLLPVPRSEGKT
jgi:hypothetical protein